MNKYIKISFDIVVKNLKVIIFIILQFVFLLVLMINYTNYISDIFYSRITTPGITETNFIYYSPMNYTPYNIANGTNLVSDTSPYECFNDLTGLAGAENTQVLFDSENPAELRAYPTNLTEKVKIDIYKGKWINDAKNEFNVINCVTSDRQQKLGEEIVFYDDFTNQSIKLKIVGIAADPYFEFNQDISGEALGLSSVIQATPKTQLEKNNYTIYWANLEDIDSIIPAYNLSTNTRLLFFNNISKEQMNTNIEILKEHGSVLTTSTSTDNAAFDSFKNEELPVLLCTVIISFIGLFCTFVILILNSKKHFLIYNICGMQKRQSVLIFICISIYIILISNTPFLFMLPLAEYSNSMNWSYSIIRRGFTLIGVVDVTILMFSFASSYLLLLKTRNKYIFDKGKLLWYN